MTDIESEIFTINMSEMDQLAEWIKFKNILWIYYSLKLLFILMMHIYM